MSVRHDPSWLDIAVNRHLKGCDEVPKVHGEGLAVHWDSSLAWSSLLEDCYPRAYEALQNKTVIRDHFAVFCRYFCRVGLEDAS